MAPGGSHRTRRGAAVAGVLLALVLPMAVTPGPVPAQAAGTTAAADSGAATVTTDERAFGFRFIRWIRRLSASAPTGPPEFRAYELLRAGRCLTLSTTLDTLELKPTATTLYGGAANACRAALAGRKRLWADATEAFQDVRLAQDEFTCMDRAAFGLLKRLVRAHQRFPNARFRLADSSEAKAPPCPSITTLEPAHGLPGTVVKIRGDFLNRYVTGVRVDFSDVSRDVDAVLVEDHLEFVMPEPGNESSPVACVVVHTEPEWDASGATFTLDEGSGTDDSQTPPECPPDPD